MIFSSSKKKQFLFVALGFLFIVVYKPIIQAQTPKIEYTFKQYTVQDGLAQMQVMVLHQDSKGYLWCVTKAGLSRFNGLEFDNFIQGIAGRKTYGTAAFGEDNQGNLLVFDHLKFYQLTNNAIEEYSYPKGYSRTHSQLKPSASKIQVLCSETSKKQILLHYSNPDSLHFTHINNKLGAVIYLDKKNKDHIWQATTDSIYISSILNSSIKAAYPNPHRIASIQRTKNKIFGFNNQAAIYELREQGFIKILATQLNPKYFKAIAVPYEDAFILKTNKDLYYYKDHLQLIRKNMTFIRDILFDSEDNLWVATEEGLYNFFQLNFTNYRFGMGNRDWVWSVVEDNQNNMWFASYQNGIWKWNGTEVTNYTSQINTKLKTHLKTIPPSVNYRYYMGVSASKNKLYFPTECNIIHYDGKIFSHKKGLTYAPYQITKTFSNGKVVFGGMSGLWEQLPNGSLKKWTAEKLNLSSVLNVETDRQSNYVALGSKGFAVVTKDSILHFNQPEYQNRICSTKDHKQSIWMAGRNGFTLFDGQQSISIPKYMDETFYSLLFVEPHYLFAGGIKGLYMANLNDYYQKGLFEMMRFDQNNGFTGIECGQNGFFTDSNGLVWIPTSDLVCRFDPQKIIHKRIIPPKLFPQVELSSNKIDWSISENFLDPFNNEQNNLRICLNTLSFSNIGKLRYYYQLSGIQNEWSQANKDNTFTFYNLSPGHYTFRAKADAGTSTTVSEEVSFTLTIAKPFWQEWWFVSLMLLFLGILGFFIVKWQTRRVRKQEIIKKRIVQLRSEALKAQMNPHLIHNALNNINGLINLGRNEEAQDFIISFSQMLRRVLKSVNQDDITLAEELDIVNSFVAFHSHAHQNSINCVTSIGNGVNPHKILIPPMLIQPYVENAILHGILPLKDREGLIEINISHQNERLQIQVKDNGIGLGKSQLKGSGLSTKLTQQRIDLLDKKARNTVTIRTLQQGTEVLFSIPLKFEEEDTNSNKF